MPEVLLIRFHFPPVGGPAAQRTLHLARQLADGSHGVTVITGPGKSDSFCMLFDDSASSETSNIRIHRLPGPVPSQSAGISRVGERMLLLRLPFRRWFETELKSAIRRSRRPDVVLGEVVPYDTACGIVGSARRLRLHFPLIADLHDPWVLDEMWLYPTMAQRLADRRRMRRVLASASAVIYAPPKRRHVLARRSPNSAIASERSRWASAREISASRRRRVTTQGSASSLGSMHTEEGLRHRRTRKLRRVLGGTPNPTVDFLPRSHVYLLKALEVLEQRSKAIVAPVEVHLAGPMTAADRAVAAVSSRTVLHGFLSHDQTAVFIVSADLLFLPMHSLRGRAGLVPAKTYEYLGSGRPILAAVPDGDARELDGGVPHDDRRS